MMVVAGAGQFLLTLIIVVVKLVYAVSVTLHFFAHRIVGSGGAKRLRFFVGPRARRGNLLAGLVVELVDMDLLHVASAQAHVPALRSGDLGTKSARLGRVAHRRR